MILPPHDLGVYIHLPFCPHVCPYCDFAVEGVGRLEGVLERRYVELLLRELALLRERFAQELDGRSLATVYFGGGTPSLLSVDALARLLDALRAAFHGEPQEITLEVNPGRADLLAAADWRRIGIDRVSIGLQALDDVGLRRLGRAHTANEARAGLERCIAAGFTSISVDLMYGIPGQTEARLLAGVEEILDAGIPHVSTYALTLEPGTPFASAAKQGRLDLPGSGHVRRMGRRVRALLAADGCIPYEISSAARAGHVARHNSRYWQRRSVLGLGVSAASLIGETRFQNPRERALWEAALTRGELPLQDLEALDPLEQRRETLALGLRRLEGISRTAYRARFGRYPEESFRKELDELASLELIRGTGDRLCLTERGVTFADEVFLRFVGN